MLPKAHLTSHSGMSGSRWVITPSWLSGSWRSFLYSSSMYCWNYPYKIYWQPHILLPLAFRGGPHSVYGACISLNKTFALLWLALEFFPTRNQEPTLGGHPRDLPELWDMNILSHPALFPATYGSKTEIWANYQIQVPSLKLLVINQLLLN